jgi:hypothetical protein
MQKSQNVWMNLAVNVVIPAVILSRFSTEETLGPVKGLIAALLFPLVYGLIELISERKWNFFSILGLLSTLLTGGLGLLQMDPFWFAVKEAAVPALIGAFVWYSPRTRYPVIQTLFLNGNVIDRAALDFAVTHKKKEAELEALLQRGNQWLSVSFALSAALNFGLARVILKSDPGTPEFNEELGRMTALSWPVIALPSMLVTFGVLFWLFRQIQKLSGLDMDRLIKKHE